MKRLLFILMIIIVLGVVGFYVFMEFRLPAIEFVTDSVVENTAGNEMVLRRLYNSETDVDAFYAQVEDKLVSTEFSDEEIYAAALASGVAQFYPAFYNSIYHPDPNTAQYRFNGIVRQEIAHGQKNADFELKNLNLEVIAEGFTIDRVEVQPKNPDASLNSAPILSEDRTTLALSLDDASMYDIYFNGASGMVTLQYTYDIIGNTIFPSVAMEDQLLLLYANISIGQDNALQVEYITEPYASLEDLE